jgi:hypothetical protein
LVRKKENRKDNRKRKKEKPPAAHSCFSGSDAAGDVLSWTAAAFSALFQRDGINSPDQRFLTGNPDQRCRISSSYERSESAVLTEDSD